MPTRRAAASTASIRRAGSDGVGDFVTDWSTDVDDEPLPTTEEGGISAEITITCSTVLVSESDTEQILDLSCTYSSNDPRFDRTPDVIRTTISPAEIGATTLAEFPRFVTGETDVGALYSGFAEDTTTVNGVGVRPGTGEFEGMLIHDVTHLATPNNGTASGTIRSTVYPNE